MKKDNDQRKCHNEQLIRRMKAGESLWSYDSKASWFPPRPIIEKDPDAIKRLYQDPGKAASTGGQSVYSSPAVRHIESRLKVVTSETSTEKKVESVG